MERSVELSMRRSCNAIQALWGVVALIVSQTACLESKND